MIGTGPDGVTATLTPWSAGYRSAAAICLAFAAAVVGFFAIPSAPPPEAPVAPPHLHCTTPESWVDDPVCARYRGPIPASEWAGSYIAVEGIERNRREHEAARAEYERKRASYNGKLRAKLAGATVAGVPMLWALLLIHRRRPIHVTLDAHGVTLDGSSLPITSFRWVLVEDGRLVVLSHDDSRIRSRPLADATAEAHGLLQQLRPFITPAVDYDEELAADASVRVQAAKLRERV